MAVGVIEAVQAGDVERVAALVAERPECAAERDDQGISALLHAAYLGRRDIVEALLPHLPALDLLEAAAVGDARRVGDLLAERPDEVDRRSGDGFTALHYAAFFGWPEIAGLLLAAGADVAAVASNPMAVQPLHSAAATSSATSPSGCWPPAPTQTRASRVASCRFTRRPRTATRRWPRCCSATAPTRRSKPTTAARAAAIARTAGHEQLAQRLEGQARPTS